MSALIITEIHCDECDDWIGGQYGTRQNIDGARRVAAEHGWTRRRLGRGRLVDLCPSCSGVSS